MLGLAANECAAYAAVAFESSTLRRYRGPHRVSEPLRHAGATYQSRKLQVLGETMPVSSSRWIEGVSMLTDDRECNGNSLGLGDPIDADRVDPTFAPLWRWITPGFPRR